MTKRGEYELTAEVEFSFDPEKVDPFWYDNDGKRTWRMEGIYSNLNTEESIWEHLAYNALVNGAYDASGLDGWGDLKRGDLTMMIVHSSASIDTLEAPAALPGTGKENN